MGQQDNGTREKGKKVQWDNGTMGQWDNGTKGQMEKVQRDIGIKDKGAKGQKE